MKASKFTEAQIAFVLKQAEDGTPVGEVCRKGDVPWSGVGAPIFGRVRSGLRSPRRAT